jgi:flagellar motor switch protein FliG
VGSNGIRKAATLLMSLDPATAAELLKSADPETVKQIAAELAYLQAAGSGKAPALADPIKEFSSLLGPGGGRRGGDFVRRLLEEALGEPQSREIMSQIEDLVKARDPFLSIRSAGAADLSRVLAGESPQAVAVVLSELPPAKSTALLSLLSEEVRLEAVCGLTGGESASAEARLRVARVVRERLQAASRKETPEADQGQREQKFRKVAVLLRGLAPAMRDPLLQSITEKDEEAGNAVKSLMLLWEDIPAVRDRSLQEGLRGVDARRLALGVVGADEAILAKLRANISERANAMLDEERSLLSSPKAEDVQQAREAILQVLREMNAKGELEFEEA